MIIEKSILEQPIVQPTQYSTLKSEVTEKIFTQTPQQQIIHKTNHLSVVATKKKSMFVIQPVKPQPKITSPKKHVVEPFHPLLTSIQPLFESKPLIINSISTLQPINKIDINVELKSKIRGPDSSEKFNKELQILQTKEKLLNTTIHHPLEKQKISIVPLKTTSTAQQTISINIFYIKIT